MDVPIRELKNRLSEYLRRVQAGEEVHVTLRGKRIARLLPEVTAPEDAKAKALARLDVMPWLRAPERAGKPCGAEEPLPAGEGSSEELVRWLRE